MLVGSFPGFVLSMPFSWFIAELSSPMLVPSDIYGASQLLFRGVDPSKTIRSDLPNVVLGLAFAATPRPRIPTLPALALQISAGKHLCLLPGDQAGREMVKHGRIFHGLVEGPITFMPTYKFEKGLHSSHLQPFYDQGEKKRVPAWTDRVFFRGSGKQWSALEPGRGGKSDVQVRRCFCLRSSACCAGIQIQF